MLKKTLLALSILFALVLLGCSKSETTNREATTPANKAVTVATPKATTSTMASAEKIGVPECDEFIAAYESCIANKVPADSRSQFNASIAQWRKSWKQLADNANTKSTLVQVCKSSMEQARTSMKVYGCTF